MKTIIKNSNIITPYEVKEGYSLVINDDFIEDIVRDSDIYESAFDKVIDLEGRYLSPGFIDIHTHGNYGHDTMESTFEAINSMAGFHVKNGVTGFLPTTMTNPAPMIVKAIRNISDYICKPCVDNKAKVLGIYLEGPYFSREKRGAQPSKYISDVDIDELKMYINQANGLVKAVALAPELTNVGEAVKYLKDQGITVAAGHTNASYAEALKGVERGITQATHLFNAMRSFSHREPGVIGSILTDERVSCELICDCIHVHPAAMKMAVKLKGKDKVILISDSMMATGLCDGKYELGGQDVFVKENVARLADGSLAGSTLTLNRAVYNMVHFVGVPLYEAVQMASLNPARAIKEDRYNGSIEIGKKANIIAFNDNLDISLAIVEGNICFDCN